MWSAGAWTIMVERIRGQRGTVVRLKVLPGKAGVTAAEKTVRLVRDTIKLEKQAAKSEIKTIRGSDGRELRIGIITVPAFYSDFEAARRGVEDYRSTTRDVRRLLKDLDGKIDGLVLDLRENGGGSLQEAVDLTGLFIGDGPVVQVRNASGRVEVEEDSEGSRLYGGPLAVLVDHASASASEIFAGAIQGLRPRHRHRRSDLRQGDGADPGRSESADPGQGSAGSVEADHRQVLSRQRQQHPASWSPAGYRHSLGGGQRGNRRECPEERVALGRDRRHPLSG